jgi:hypothetical protein
VSVACFSHSGSLPEAVPKENFSYSYFIAFRMNIDQNVANDFSNEQTETPLETKHLGSYFTMDKDHVSVKPFVGVLLNRMNEER